MLFKQTKSNLTFNQYWWAELFAFAKVTSWLIPGLVQVLKSLKKEYKKKSYAKLKFANMFDIFTDDNSN